MPNDHIVFKTGFGEQLFEIKCNNKDAYNLAVFLFSDFPGSASLTPSLKYDILSVGRQPMLSLWLGERRLYFGV